VVVALQLDVEPEVITDLTPEERRAADEWPPITADDVLDIHQLLKEFDGDFLALMAQ
jgi:hypothetical protein